ncbi:type VII secretion integral membrane protein EccD [Streptomyces spiramenti]|uniref:Type VII secretion integral membrane protein EccD n=1 Tax=Streptomyces spiramenti TaxID=2720606 RepID=A0ABX1AVK8_9ACTN|nr:type VII secretion integral membrane protein EccD [Streptomyces spiramenti]NJP68345.1 type VII secretion integral membrane protein EccD [Streptomyces spiramenti]
MTAPPSNVPSLPAQPTGPAVTAAAGGAEFVRIGVAGGAGRADLAVPATLPLARLMPSLLQHAGEEAGADGGVRHGGWVLCRVDGSRLEPARSLGAQQVVEGDLLFLRHGDDDTTEPLYDDVVEVITAHGTTGTWTTRATRVVSAVLSSLTVLAACGALAAAPGRVPGALGLGVAALALGVAVLLSRGFGDTVAGTCAAVLAAPPAMTGAVLLLGVDGGAGAAHLLLACAVLAVVGGIGPVAVGGGDGVFTALVVAGLLACVGALISTVWGVAPERSAAVAAPLALALTTALPALALRLARSPAPQVAGDADDLEKLPSQLEHAALRARIERARLLLVGMVAGCHLVVGGGILVLFASGELWPSVCGGVLLVLVMLRSRLFKDATQALIPLVTALVAVAGAAGFLVLRFEGRSLPLLGVILPVALIVALIAGAVGLLAGRRTPNPRALRGLDMAEAGVLLSVVPLVLAVWGVYGALLDLTA